MSNGNKFNWIMVVMLAVLSAFLVYLVVVNGNVEYKDPGSPYSSPNDCLKEIVQVDGQFFCI